MGFCGRPVEVELGSRGYLETEVLLLSLRGEFAIPPQGNFEAHWAMERVMSVYNPAGLQEDWRVRAIVQDVWDSGDFPSPETRPMEYENLTVSAYYFPLNDRGI